MRTFVGTSGWAYGWNKGGTLDWYAAETGLNAVELNASFYRFPFRNQIKGWASRGAGLTWCIKVNRLVTHVHILNQKAASLYDDFLELFEPMRVNVAFYLLQMPPRFTSNMHGRFEDFVKSFDDKRMAVEFRHESWYGFDFDRLDFGGAIVTPDSPEMSGRVFAKNGLVYVRFHGRRGWYSYRYSAAELRDVAGYIARERPRAAFAFFNNDHDMLRNAVEFKRVMGRFGAARARGA